MTDKLSERLVEYFTILCENNNFPPVETKLVDDCRALEAELAFIHSEYTVEKNENLTKDALWLKIAGLEAEVKSLKELQRELISENIGLRASVSIQIKGRREVETIVQNEKTLKEDVIANSIKLVNEILDLKTENKSLKEEIIGLKELNNGLDYCAEESDRKRRDAEASLNDTVEAWRKAAIRWTKEKDVYESRLSEAKRWALTIKHHFTDDCLSIEFMECDVDELLKALGVDDAS